ncbi:MAG: hypothetical protein KAW12_14455 [Candidatus Aminicenantes bacterium]|nr:hypothetical protein [Candidatus Aminicenantes bacterium]
MVWRTHRERRDRFSSLRKKLERELAGGDAALEDNDVLEMFLLYFKYHISPGSLLIVEEPESSQDSRSREILAKYLIKLTHREVKLLIITYSKHMVEQLESWITLNRCEEKGEAVNNV